MKFEDVLPEMRNGKSVARKQFRDTCTVRIQYPSETSMNTLPYLVMEKGEHIFPVPLSCESIFADDWYVVK